MATRNRTQRFQELRAEKKAQSFGSSGLHPNEGPRTPLIDDVEKGRKGLRPDTSPPAWTLKIEEVNYAILAIKKKRTISSSF